MRRPLILIVLLYLTSSSYSQQLGQYVLNIAEPYLNVPGAVGSSGYTNLSLNYRQRWAGLEGAPNTFTLLFQHPINEQLSLGVNLGNDERGLLNTFSASGTIGYRLYFGRSASTSHSLGFGLSGGVSRTDIDLDEVENPLDPALDNILDNTYSAIGQFGLHYTYKKLQIGFSLPRLFVTEIVSEEEFNTVEIEEFGYTFSSISYAFDINPDVRITPQVIYQTNERYEDYLRLIGTVHLKNMLWVGGSYEINQGLSFHLGLRIGKKLGVSYGYELARNQTPDLGEGTHEFMLTLQTGKTDRLASLRPDEVLKEDDYQSEPSLAEQKTDKTAEEETSAVDNTQEPDPVEADLPEVEEKAEKVNQPVVEEPISRIEELEEREETEETETNEENPTILEEEITETTDLPPGHYVIVGTFENKANAMNYANQCQNLGYSVDTNYHRSKKYYYITIGFFDDLQAAKDLRDEMRALNALTFDKTWVLTIE